MAFHVSCSGLRMLVLFVSRDSLHSGHIESSQGRPNMAARVGLLGWCAKSVVVAVKIFLGNFYGVGKTPVEPDWGRPKNLEPCF